MLLGCGAVLDHCVVALAAAGWSPRVRRFPDGGQHSHLAILEVVEQPPEAGYLELAGAISRRHADRRRYPAGRIPPATLELLYIRAARMGVELAVVPRSRWTRAEDGSVALWFPAVVGEPDDNSVLLVLGTREDNDAMRLRAGEALSHLYLTVTAMGLVSCPLTVPLNDMRSRLALACELFDGDAHPQALIRLGPPPAMTGPDRRPSADRPAKRPRGQAESSWARVWIERSDQLASTLDLVGPHFLLVTGADGERHARELDRFTDVPIRAVVLGRTQSAAMPS